MKLYYHSVLTSNKSQDNKLLKNACEKIVLNIFFKAQTEMKREVEKIVISQYPGEEGKEISRALFTGRREGNFSDLELLKENLREKAVEKYSGVQELNLTELARENSINITRAREELENLGGKWFVFNFISRKKIPKELLTRVVKDVGFVQREEGLIFAYRIPKKVLNFLVFPDQYAAVDMDIIRKLKLKYSIKLYLLVLDHKKRGILELKKHEIMECFSLPKSYCKNRKNFQNKFLLPTLCELERVAKLKLTYDFKQGYSFRQLELKIEKNRTYFSQKILEKIEFAKRNRYIQSAWDTKAHDFLLAFYQEKGEEQTVQLLQSAYQKLNGSIRTTLSNCFLFLSKQMEVKTQEGKKGEARAEKGSQGSHGMDKITSWEYYSNLPPSDQKIYGNLARMLFEEKLGRKKYHEEFFQAAFRSLINEIIEME